MLIGISLKLNHKHTSFFMVDSNEQNRSVVALEDQFTFDRFSVAEICL